MPRWNANLDDPWTEDSDSFFIAYNEKIHRSLLPPGYVAKSVNKRFHDRTAKPRNGTTMPAGNLYFGAITPGVTFLGSTVYSNPNGQERLILMQHGDFGAGAVAVVAFNFDAPNPSQGLITIGFPGGQPLSPVYAWFAQGFDKLVMLGVGITHGSQTDGSWTNGLSWDGNEALGSRMFQWFAPVSPPNPEVAVIPPSLFAWPVSNRIVYLPIAYPQVLPLPPGQSYTENLPTDNLILSDIEAYATYDFILGLVRVNAGEADFIKTIIPYSYDSMVVGKSNSLQLVSNFSQILSLTNPVVQELITHYCGICNPRAFAQIGTEVYFMAEKLGVFKLSEVIEKRLMALPIPVSDPIKPVIDRINWAALHIPFSQNNASFHPWDLVIAATLDEYLYFAVPLDGSTVNNVVLVFNTVTGNWETIDMWAAIPGFRIDNLLPIHIGGEPKLLAIQNDPALVYVIYDETAGTDQSQFQPATFSPISDLIETRGYGLQADSGPISFRTFHRGGIVMETLNPNVKITALTEGPYEEKILRASITKDPTQNYVHGIPPYGISRDATEKREDYSIGGQMGEMFAAQDFEMMPEAPVPGDRFPPAPPNPDPNQTVEPAQACREPFQIRMTDRWLSLRIENSQGYCRLLATSVESTESSRNRTAA